jgi:hypothetical protein
VSAFTPRRYDRAGHGRRRADIAAHALLVAATVVFEWPAVRHFSTRPVGAGGDSSNVLWSWNHLAGAVAHGHDPIHTTALFFPVGVDLAFHTFAPGLVLLLTPLIRLAGPVPLYNLAQLGATFLSFLGAFLLGRRLGASRWAAVAGALAFGMCSYRVLHINEHPRSSTPRSSRSGCSPSFVSWSGPPAGEPCSSGRSSAARGWWTPTS